MKKLMIVIISILIVVCTALGIIGYLESKKEKDPSDNEKDYKIEYKYYLDGVEVSEMPVNEEYENTTDSNEGNNDTNNEEETLAMYSFEKYDCTNNVKGIWDNDLWQFSVPEKNSDATCVLYFISNYFEVEIKANNGVVNELEALKDRKVKRGESIIYNITPTEGYNFEKVECTNNATAEWNEENSTLTVSNVTKNSVCEVTYSIGEYTIKFTANNGAISEETRTAKYGDTITTIVTPGSDYIYNKVSCSDGQTATYDTNTNTLTVSNVTKNSTCTVDFKSNKYTVTLKIVNGTPIEDTKTVESGNRVSFTFNSNEGYTTNNPTIECENGLVGRVSGSLFTIDNVSKSGTCTLTFNPIEN